MIKTDNDDILENEARLLIATQTNDVVELDGLLHEKSLFIDQRGRIITKPRYLETHRSGDLIIDLLRVKEHTINLIGGVAVVTSLLHLMGNETNQAIAGTFRYSRVWKRDDGIWQVVAGSCVQLI